MPTRHTSPATAELVLSLAARRKSLAGRRADIDQALAQIRDLRTRFLQSIDRDIAVLNELLLAQRAAKSASPDERETADAEYNRALASAAVAPLDLARDGLTLLRLINLGVPIATRFTAPDLGAAATMSHGAIEAALLMSEVNVALLGDHPEARTLGSTVAHLRQEAPAVANEVLHLTRAKMAGALPEGDAGD